MSLARRRQDKRIIAAVRPIARRCGYAIGIHGSQGPKDLDLIAAPWTPAAVSAEELIAALTTEPGLLLGIGALATQGPLKPARPQGLDPDPPRDPPIHLPVAPCGHQRHASGFSTYAGRSLECRS